MATFANIVINDGKTPVVSHTFSPAFRRDNMVGWADRAPGVVAGFRTVILTTRPANSSNAGTRVNVKVVDPRLATLGTSDAGIVPNPTKAYETLAEFTFLLPQASDREARLDIIAYVKGLLANPQIQDSIVDLAPPI